jgi:hypothetical protein
METEPDTVNGYANRTSPDTNTQPIRCLTSTDISHCPVGDAVPLAAAVTTTSTGPRPAGLGMSDEGTDHLISVVCMTL